MFKRSFLFTLVLFSLLLITAGTAFAHGDDRPVKKGILLVAFGTSVPQAQKSFDDIDAKVKKAFPGIEVRWAYTSKIIRHKLAKEENRHVDSPAEALAKMMNDDFTLVAVQSLHTIPGEEYHSLLRTAHAFSGLPKGMKKVLVGYPLLSTPADVEKVVQAMTGIIPKSRKPGEAVVLMGHGTHHPGNIYYPGVQYFFWQKDPNILVGTVEGTPSLDDVVAELKKRGIKKAYLMPFMSVAGDHARNDMAGPEADSWISVLTKNGVKCEAVLKGTAEYPAIADIWVDHLKSAMAHFE